MKALFSMPGDGERKGAGVLPFSLLGPASLLVAGLTGSAALASGASPLPPGDPFATTLAALPAWLAGWLVLGGLAHAKGARPGRPGERWALASGLGLFVLLAVARPSLDLPFSAPALAAFGALVLTLATARRVLSLRPLLGDFVPRRPSWLFLALPLAVYLIVAPWSTSQRPPDGDEPWYLLITHSLVDDLDAELTDEYAKQSWRAFMDRPLTPQPGDPVGPDGELYSRHNALLAVLLAPAYAAAGKAGAIAVMALLTALAAWLTLRLGYHYFPRRPGEVLAAYSLVAFAPPLLLYSHQIWVEVPAALLALTALDRILVARARRDEGSGGRLRFWVVLLLLLALLPLLKIRFMLLALPLVALAWWRLGRPWGPLLAVGSVLAVLGAGILAYNQVVYDNPLKIHTWQEVGLLSHGIAPYFEGGVGLLFDTAFGLMPPSPLWFLLVPAVLLILWRAVFAHRRFDRPGAGTGTAADPDRRAPDLLFDLVVITLPYLAVVAPRAEWYGGWSPPFRYALVALPLLGLALVPLLARRRRPGARALLAALGALTLAFALLWLAVPGWTYNFADGRAYWLDALSRELGADAARLFPSYVRPRLASWVWPAASLVLLPLVWWGVPRRPGRPGEKGGGGSGKPGGAAELWGLTAAVLLVAVLPAGARMLPSRTVDLEDAQVVKTGGRAYPNRWIIERTHYRGGWILREGEALTVPVVSGGERVDLALAANFVRQNPSTLLIEVRTGAGEGERVLAVLTLADDGLWHNHRLGEHLWTPGDSLTVEVKPSGLPGRPNAVVLDRLELDWR